MCIYMCIYIYIYIPVSVGRGFNQMILSDLGGITCLTLLSIIIRFRVFSAALLV